LLGIQVSQALAFSMLRYRLHDVVQSDEQNSNPSVPSSQVSSADKIAYDNPIKAGKGLSVVM
jgi:hypothetical protein